MSFLLIPPHLTRAQFHMTRAADLLDRLGGPVADEIQQELDRAREQLDAAQQLTQQALVPDGVELTIKLGKNGGDLSRYSLTG